MSVKSPTTVGYLELNLFAQPNVSLSVVEIPIGKQQKSRFASDETMLGRRLAVALVDQTGCERHYWDHKNISY